MVTPVGFPKDVWKTKAVNTLTSVKVEIVLHFNALSDTVFGSSFLKLLKNQPLRVLTSIRIEKMADGCSLNKVFNTSLQKFFEDLN